MGKRNTTSTSRDAAGLRVAGMFAGIDGLELGISEALPVAGAVLRNATSAHATLRLTDLLPSPTSSTTSSSPERASLPSRPGLRPESRRDL